MNNWHPEQLKNQNLGAILELPAKQKHYKFGPFTKKSGKMGWIGVVGSSKTAPRILIFLTAMSAKPKLLSLSQNLT